jgi:tetratricopeptide (TPR) repeat protein
MSSIEDAPSDSYPNQASELRSRIRSCLHALKKVDDLQMIKDTIGLAREAYALSIENKTDRHQACLLLAESIRQGFNRCADDRLLEEMIMLEREALTLAPERHPKRAVSCGSLASSLWTCYMRTGDISLLNEAIELERETFNLQPEGHPERAKSCGNLANSLRTCYDRTGDLGLLDEAIDLQREALALRSNSGHPGRSLSCGNLAISLKTRYERTGNIGLLDEAIDLQREALDLRPQGHPGRSMSCGNLASSLWMRYERTGDVDLLDEAIDLQRNALDLLPAGHPHHSWSCGNLATSLKTRYERTGDVDLLEEAIDLQRKALDLRPEGHPYRSSSCGNLATSLKTWYARMGDVRCLDEAIGLQREALDLRPEGHPYRSLSCEILASSLKTRYERTGDVGLLDEAIALQREALNLRPQGHPYRYMSFGNLATSLKIRYERTDDVALLHDSLILSQSAVAIAPVHAIWRYLHHLAHMHLMNTSPSYDVNKAILYLSKSLEHDPDDTLAFVVSLSSILDDFWEYNLEGKHIQLTTIYQRLVNLLPLLVHPALGIQPQLQALKRCTRLGSDAFVNAALADSCSVGLEALELAQGVIWSQSLHRRDPQLKDVPDHLASKLQSLLRSFAIDSAKGPAPQIDDEEQRWLTPRDMVHAQNSRAHAVIREIRALPGLDRFMLGETFETLRTVASDHPVVVLVGARGDYYALIMSPSLAQEALLSLNLTSDDEMTLLFTKTSRRQSRGGLADEPGVDRGLRIITPSGTDSLGRQFKVLWNKVVKPVFDHLDLKVSECDSVT